MSLVSLGTRGHGDGGEVVVVVNGGDKERRWPCVFVCRASKPSVSRCGLAHSCDGICVVVLHCCVATVVIAHVRQKERKNEERKKEREV